jgi:hypothetical protein
MDTRKLIDFSMEDNGVEFRNQLYASIHDRVTAAIEAKKQEIAQNLVTQESVVNEGTMTHIKLGPKVKGNDEYTGHTQSVHYKGEHIGSISSYPHRDGTKYEAHHDESNVSSVGHDSPEEAIKDLRSVHAEYKKYGVAESLEKMDSKRDPENDKPGEMKDARRKDSKKKDQSTNKSGQEMNEEDSLHPMASQVLKHIKPEHHDVYKPHLAKGTFNGSYADRRDVLKAAENAGHLINDEVQVNKKPAFPSAKGPSQSGAV